MDEKLHERIVEAEAKLRPVFDHLPEEAKGFFGGLWSRIQSFFRGL